MPAAAVIPAPIAYTKVVAVKKLVVGFLCDRDGKAPCSVFSDFSRILPQTMVLLIEVSLGIGSFTLKKIECLKQGFPLNKLAWNNDKGLWFYLLVFGIEVMIDRDSWGH